MRTIPISTFNATCLALLEEVRQTGEPIVVTKRRVPVVRIEPPATTPAPRRKLGVMRGRGSIIGDIETPISPEGDWEVLR